MTKQIQTDDGKVVDKDAIDIAREFARHYAEAFNKFAETHPEYHSRDLAYLCAESIAQDLLFSDLKQKGYGPNAALDGIASFRQMFDHIENQIILMQAMLGPGPFPDRPAM